jgi:hypothetical protein
MAWIHDNTFETVPTTATAVPEEMPEHETGDLLVVKATNDNGNATIAASGWTEIGTQERHLQQRTAWFYKIATSDSETISITGDNRAWNIDVVTIRDFDASDPIEGYQKFNMPSNSTTCASPSYTTTEDNVLLLYGWGFRATGGLTVPPDELTGLSAYPSSNNDRMGVLGYRSQFTTGSAPTATAKAETTGRGGQSFIIGIRDSGDGKMPPSLGKSYRQFARHGLFDQAENLESQLASNTLNANGLTSIAGIPTSTIGATSSQADPFAETPIGRFSRIVYNITPSPELMVGSYYTIPSTDFTDAIFSYTYAYQFGTTAIGPLGLFICFGDDNDNWSVFRLSERQGAVADQIYNTFIACDKWTPYETSGTIDWTAVTRIGFAIHREQSTSARLYIRDANLYTDTTIVGGNQDNPANTVFLQRLFEGWGQFRQLGRQGEGQILNSTSLQIGDGTTPTYFDATATAYEMPREWMPSRLRRFWQVPEESVGFTIKASQDDIIRFRSFLIATPTKQIFEIDETSSTDAHYDFSGSIFVGWRVLGRDGVEFNGNTFNTCYNINLRGGDMVGCDVSGALDASAVTTYNPEAITNTSFTQSEDGGHAIEATETGSFDFIGNTFEGYGADESTDAAFYNNSGGEITLVIPVGGQTPTVRNSAGSTTAIDTPSTNQSGT